MSKKIDKIIKTLNDKTKMLAIEILDSPIKWDLISFYQANPFSIHTARGLSNIIGRSADRVFKEAEELARAGVLRKISENGDMSSIYSYEPTPENRALIQALFDFCKEERTLMDELCEAIRKN